MVVAFYRGRDSVGDVGIGPMFFETRRCGEVARRPTSVEEWHELLMLLDPYSHPLFILPKP